MRNQTQTSGWSILKGKKFFVAGGHGNLGSVLVNSIKEQGGNVFIGGRNKGHADYQVGSCRSIGGDAIGIIATTTEGVKGALDDFKTIPTVVVATGYDTNVLQEPKVPILDASNLALPVASFFKIFSDIDDFSGLKMRVAESHQSGKKDPSGTAMKVIKIFTEKGGECRVSLNRKKYEANTGISDLGDLRTYRGEESRAMAVSEKHLGGHGYHTYTIRGGGKSFSKLCKDLEMWYSVYSKTGYTGFNSDLEIDSGRITVSHNIDGRSIYGDGLIGVLPWFSQQIRGSYSIEDYLS